MDNEINYEGQFPSDFQEDPNFYALFAVNGLHMGRMIGGSKSGYLNQHPEDLVIFNANVITKLRKKIWYGDLNVTLDFDNLKNVADKLGEDLYILSEHDARFGSENEPIKKLMAKAKTIIKCNKKT